MTREDIIRMAREAGWPEEAGYALPDTGSMNFKRFAALVAAAEREACAKVCDRVGYDHEVQQGAELAFDLANAIRARGQA